MPDRCFVVVAAALLCACASEVARGQAALAPSKPSTSASAAEPLATQGAEDLASMEPRVPHAPELGSTQSEIDAEAEAEPDLAPPPIAVATPIEDPSAQALAAFHAALTRAALGEGQARIAFYGASHVASDMFTGPLRERLQERFGDAGPGFVLPARPWRYYRHAAIEIEPTRGWREARVLAKAPKSDIYGLAGVALDLKNRFAAAAIQIKRAVPEGQSGLYELWYLRQPNGGRLGVFINGKRAGVVSTRGDHKEPGYSLFSAGPGVHRVELRAHGDGPIRLFGLAVERPTPGVVLDTLGIPGARARYHLNWHEQVYREHLARRQPDLVVLAYGTNESGDDDVPIASYEAELTSVITRMKDTVPNASCLLIGPSDRPLRVTDEETGEVRYESRPRTAALVESQRRIATRFGCGFFDLVAFMGGELSMLRWVSAEPPLGTPDHVHFTRLGYERLGEVLHDALLAGFPEAPMPSAPSDTLAIREHRDEPRK